MPARMTARTRTPTTVVPARTRTPTTVVPGRTRTRTTVVPARMTAVVIFFVVLLICPLPAAGLTLVYTEEGGEATTVHTLLIEPTAAGHSIELTSTTHGSPAVVQHVVTREDFSVLSWRYHDPAADTEVVAVRDRSVISLQGRHKGSGIARTLSINSRPWYQLFPHGLERLAASGTGTARFWAIGVEGIGAMRAGAFRASVVGSEQVEWKGRAVDAVHVRISLAGLASILWRGDYWYRPGDGRNLISRSDRGPGTGPIRIELTAER